MTSLVERLRDWENIYEEDAADEDGALYRKAADEIERLQACAERAEAALFLAQREINIIIQGTSSV